jgi:hypothetical protein
MLLTQIGNLGGFRAAFFIGGGFMGIKCRKILRYEISGYDARILLSICTLAQLIIEGKSDGKLPAYIDIDKKEIDQFITTIFNEFNTED